MQQKKSGFIPLQELQAMAIQKMGGKQPQLQPRPRISCPPKPDDYDNSSFYGDNIQKKTDIKNQNTDKNITNSTDILSKTTMPQSHIYSKYEIRQDTMFYIRFGITWSDERLIVCEQDKLNKDVQSHWLKFRMWTFEQCNQIKNKCCQLDQYRNYVYNKVKLFRNQLKYLLVDWSFGVNDSNMRLMHVDKVLSDQSINLIMNMHPNILFFVQESLKDILQGNR